MQNNEFTKQRNSIDMRHGNSLNGEQNNHPHWDEKPLMHVGVKIGRRNKPSKNFIK